MNTPKIEPWMIDAADECLRNAVDRLMGCSIAIIEPEPMINIIARHATPILAEKDAEIAKLKIENKTYHDLIIKLLCNHEGGTR